MSLLDALLLDPAPFNIWIAARTDGIKGSGTASDPYNGSTQARFDSVMQTIAGLFPGQKVAIHLGPGEFITAGYAESDGNAWEIKAGMRILGSGRGVTTLKRATGSSSGFVLGHDLATAADYFELCDLTLDCNLTTSPGGGATCGAVRVLGTHVRLARVRAKNWGCSLTNQTCYVFAVITANSSGGPFIANCGMEGCIADEPAKLTGSPANTGTVVMFHAGASSAVGVSQEGYALSPYIRNCFGQWDVSITGTQARGLSMNWCRGGVVEGNHIHGADYGGPYPGIGTTVDLIVRNNFFKNVQHGMNWPQGGFTSALSITSIAKDPGDNTLAKVVTNVPHNYQVAERVRVVPTDGSASAFTGYFAISAIDIADNKVFKFRLPTSNPANPSPATGTVQKVFSMGRLIVEGNIIELRPGVSNQRAIMAADNAGSTPTYDYVYGEVIVRNNKIRYMDGASPTDSGATIIEVQGAKSLHVKDNVLDTIATAPLANRRCGAATYFNNRTPGGSLIEGFNPDTVQRYAELESDTDFAQVLSLFNRRAR